MIWQQFLKIIVVLSADAKEQKTGTASGKAHSLSMDSDSLSYEYGSPTLFALPVI